MTHPLAYKIHYCKTVMSIMGYHNNKNHKVIILFLPHYQFMNSVILVKKYEFVLHIMFLFLMFTVSDTYDIYSILYYIRQY